jgi:hypothetical protein
MRRIIRPPLAVVALILVAGIAACSSGSPTAVTTAPAAPHFDGGGSTFGSGNFVPERYSADTQRGGITFGSGNVVSADVSENPTAADSGSTATRGVGFGSGN